MLTDLFGESAFVKVLDFLLEEWDLDFSKADVSRETGVSWKTLHELWPRILEMQLIVPSRTINRANLYKINGNSALIKALRTVDLEVSAVVNSELATQEGKMKLQLQRKAVARPSGLGF